jgi:hypothetical protein
VPYLQVSPAASFSIFKDTSLPLARVSTLSVEDVTVKGPNGELVAVSAGYELINKVILALPV